MIKWCYIIAILSISTLSFAQEDSLEIDTTDLKIKELSFVDQLDSMLLIHYNLLSQFTTDTSVLNSYNYSADSVPRFSDDIFKFRIGQLDEQSPFDFISNDATIAMIKLYAYKRKNLTKRMLSNAELYFPIFEECLIKHEMPLELKYLPIVESALNPNAISRAGAGGLWQFMPKTGKMYGLDITSYVDERFDPYLATEAACKYLKFLHSIYNDWSMALAAYNAGPGNVNKAIRRSGGKTSYWEIRPELFKETQNYVPAFIAVNYIMKYASEHNLYPDEPLFTDMEIDTINVCERIEFLVLDQWVNINVGKLKYLNPMYKLGVIPKPDSSTTLYLPTHLIGDFIRYEDSIYKYSSLEFQHLEAANTPARKETIHYIKSGETMASIAKKYNCSVEEIKAWNTKSNESIKPGRKLYVYVEMTEEELNAAKNDQSNPINTSAVGGEYTYYTIQKGDTLWDIAQKHNGITVNDLMRINSNLNFNNLQTGTKIKIGK